MRTLCSIALVVLAPLASAMAQDHTTHTGHPASDSSFRAVQQRGAQVMGVDQYTSRHVFEALPDGGRIELQRELDDSAGVVQIRGHLAEVAKQFAEGTFSAPFLVHDQLVPGTRVMTSRRARIRYEVRSLARGGEIRIITRDRAAIRAIHEFLAFQNKDHRTTR